MVGTICPQLFNLTTDVIFTHTSATPKFSFFFAISYTPNNNTLIETLTLTLLRLLLNFGPSITFLCFFANLSLIYSSSDLSVFPQPVHKILRTERVPIRAVKLTH